MKPLLFLLPLIAGICADAQQWGDYTLYSVQNSSNAYLIDTTGATYHTWTFSSSKKTGYSSYLLPGGDIIRAVANQGNSLNGGGMTGAVQKCDWDGNVLWDYVYSSSTYCLHHDICPLPNGNVLMISYDVHSASEMTAAGSSINHAMWLDKIIEVQPTGTSGGTIVWEWRAYDHLSQNVDATKSNYVSSIVQHPELLNINYGNNNQTQDWLHMNGLDYNEEKDQIIVSSHFMNEIYVIDHSTTTAEAATHSGGNSGKGGDILYRWGNPAAYGASGTATLDVVHDAHWVPQGCPHAGYIVGFNNDGGSNGNSCIDMVDAPENGYLFDYTVGQALTPTTYTVRQNCTGHTGNMGCSEQLPNGNMLICIAQSGLIYEIDPNGTTIWSKTINGTVPQAHRYTACYVSGATAPATPNITQSGNTLTSTSGSIYQWYLNGAPINGATSQSYTATATGLYQVAVSEAGDCFSELSEGVNIVINGIAEWNAETLNMYPNPTDGIINLSGTWLQDSNVRITVMDSSGRLVFQSSNSKTIDLSALESGLYFVRAAKGTETKTSMIQIVR